MRSAPAALALPVDVDHVPGLVAQAAGRWPGDEAVRFDLNGESLTFAELHTRTNAIAHQLLDLGVEPGDRVAVMCRNRAEFPLAWIGIIKARATMVPINTFAMDSDAGHLIGHSGSRVMVVEEPYLPLAESLRDATECLQTLVVAAPDDPSTSGPGPQLSAEHRDAPPYDVYLDDELANIQYTSGTTGKPKGCMLSNGYWTLLSRLVIDHAPHLQKDDVLLTAQPFSYMDPQWNLLAGLQVGARVVVLDRFHPSTFWTKIVEHEATFFYCLGAMPALMARMPLGPEDRAHRVRYIACSAIPTHLHRELEERYGAPWFELFGSTETGGDLTVAPEEREDLVGTACIGRPYPHREVRVVDVEDRPVERGMIGEIVLRGIAMMDGYFGDPEATLTSFRGGWYHTGDLGRMDESGRVFFHGRSKDIIRRSGENVSAVEVESTIGEHEAVRLAACVPVDDELRGEEIKAIVVLQPGMSARPEELAAFCGDRLAYYKVPRYWEFRQELPMTESQKIAKGQLREESPDDMNAVVDLSVDTRA